MQYAKALAESMRMTKDQVSAAILGDPMYARGDFDVEVNFGGHNGVISGSPNDKLGGSGEVTEVS
jgi:hypothetical protein